MKSVPGIHFSKRGFSTIEVLLALALFSLVFGAIIQVSASNQNIVIDTAISNEALGHAQNLLEEAVVTSKNDFALINTTQDAPLGQFKTHIEVETEPDFESKVVTAKVSWNGFGFFDQYLTLSTLIIKNQNQSDTDTCDSNLTGDWTLPQTVSTFDLGQLIGDSAGVYPITDIDAYFGTLFVTTNNSSSNKPTIHILDSHDPSHISFIKSLDNDPANNTGVNAITVGLVTGKEYAFVASASSFVKGQLQIIETQSPYGIVTYKIPTSIVRGSSTQGVGNTVFYLNGYVYLGLKKTVSGPEFNIIDVHDPVSPVWVGGYDVGNGVNNILVKNGYAYIASPNNQELITLDVSDPSNPYYVGGFDAPDNVGNGKNLYGIGGIFYLGRTVTSQNPEFLILDNTNPNTNLPPPLGTKEVGSSVNGLFVRDHLAFILSNTDLQIYNVIDSKQIQQFSGPITLTQSGGSPAPSLECEGDYMYVGSNNSSNRGYISIVSSQ